MGQRGEERHESVPGKRQDGGAVGRSRGSWLGCLEFSFLLYCTPTG